MKKSRLLLLYLCLLLVIIAVPLIACATDTDGDGTDTDTEKPVLYTWESLATYGGAYAVTLVIAPLLKKWIDKKKKHYLEAYTIATAFVLLLGATLFTEGISWKSGILLVVNAFVVGMAVYGTKASSDRRRERLAEKNAA